MKNEHGFSLVELLIVVAIIAIIAAIAVPSLLTSRMAANEASAIQGCRTIGSAEIAFAATNNQQFTDLASLYTGQFLDGRFSATANVINGYTYGEDDVPVEGGTAFTSNLPTGFAFVATPNSGLGRFSYGVGPDQVVRYVGYQDPATGYPTGSDAGTPIGKNN
jgi:prepilin-type N-terminal cleavage/methylation domain-containing protein